MRRISMAVGVLVLACQGNVLGSIGGGGGVVPGSPNPGAPNPGTPNPGRPNPLDPNTPLPPQECDGLDGTLRTLSRNELKSNLNVLIQDVSNRTDQLPADGASGGFGNDRYLQVINDAKVGLLEETVINAAVDAAIAADNAKPQNARKLLTCDVTQATCVKQIITTFARLAWRKAPSADDVKALVALHTSSSMGGDALTGIRWVMKAILLSPEFVFFIEAGQSPLDPHTLASRLSFYLWGQNPDDALLKAAEDGTLMSPQGYEAQVSRLLADMRAAEHFTTNIAGDWFGINQRIPLTLSGAQYDKYNAAKDSFKKETVAFVRSIFESNAPVNEMLTADYSYVDQAASAFYGLQGGSATLEKRTLPAGRAGLMTQPFMMASLAGPKAPIFRGVFVIRNVLGRAIELPKGVVIPDLPVIAGSSVKELLNAHRINNTCKSCHDVIDGIGLALEELDAAGRLRTQYEDGKPVESTATLWTKKTVTGPRELALALNDEGEFDDYFVTQLSSYAYGVGHEYVSHERNALIKANWKAKSSNTRDLIAAVANSTEFKSVCGTRK